MSRNSSMNKALLIAVIALAVALVVVVLYFTILSRPSSSNVSRTSQTTSSATQTTLSLTTVFMDGVEDWIGLRCTYYEYGSGSALNLIHEFYQINYLYNVEYSETGNTTYLLLYPVLEYDLLTKDYPNCAFNYNLTYLVNYVNNALNNVTVVQGIMNIPSSFMGTPLFIIYNRVNHVTYIVVGASPYPFTAVNYALNGTLTTFTYQGQELGFSYTANSTQISMINQLVNTGLDFGNPNAKIIFIEFLDPLCPYCAVFDVEYSNYLDNLISNGTIYYVVQYFPTHVLSYYPGSIG